MGDESITWGGTFSFEFESSPKKERRNNMVSLGNLGEARGQKKIGTFGAIFFTLLLCLAVGGLGTTAQGAEKGPIKIGFIAPHTGNFAQMGMDMVEGFKLFLEENNYTVAGRKIEFIVEDEGDNPSTAVTKVRKLITQDKVHLVAGVFMTSAAYAVAPVCAEAGVPLISTLTAGDDLTQRKRSPYFARVSFTGGELGLVAGDYAYNKLGWRKAVAIGMDYGWGHEGLGGFQRQFEALGGKVIQKVWTPVTTMDFGPYVASLKRDGDGVVDWVTGAASIRFLKSLRSSGLMDKWKVMVAGTGTDETLLPAIGDTGLGVLSVFNWSAALNNPENVKFGEKIHKRLNREGTLGMSLCYTGADWILRAIKAVDGQVENKEKFIQALRAIEIPDSMRGPLKMDKYGHVIQSIYIRRIDKVGNTFQNTVIETYPMATQFFKFDPETYLKTPVSSRDYPPCKFCE
jgi:branched-chain amino acid transport system substrate-binding protein